MKIAIEKSRSGFTERWQAYCDKVGIEYGLVDASNPDIVEVLAPFDAFVWHVSHEKRRDNLMAKELLHALHSSGKVVFPTPEQMWHFDDKIAQHYFFEAHHFPAPKSTVVYSKRQALEFLKTATFPSIVKLRRGSASSNVFKIDSAEQGRKLVKKAFGKGFPLFNLKSRYGDKLEKSKNALSKAVVLVQWAYRMWVPPAFSKESPNEKGYLIFQQFIPNNGDDVRVVVVNDKAVALRRKVREDDFRASGSGILEFPNEALDPTYISLAFDVQKALKAPSMGVDFIASSQGNIHVIEMSYGFPSSNFLDGASGYWTPDLTYHEGPIQLQEWMLDWVIDQVNKRKAQ